MTFARYTACGLFFAALTYTSSVLAVGGEGAADKGQGTTLDLTYNLYVGGIPLGSASMSARFEGQDYKAISTLETQGIVNRLWQSKIETSSSGTVDEGRVQPALYDSYSQNRQVQRRHATLTFGPEGPVRVFSDPPYPDNRYPVSETQMKRTLDPLSAVIAMTDGHAANPHRPCDSTAPIFDGRRRYDVEFHYVRKTSVDMDNGLYRGPGMVCTIRYKQIAGWQPSVIEQGKKFPLLNAWVISVNSPSDPRRQYLLPVRVWAETDYGVVVAVASDIKLDGAKIGKPS